MEDMIHEPTRRVCGACVYFRAQARKGPQLLCSVVAVGDPARSEGRKPTIRFCRTPLAPPTSILHLAAGCFGTFLFCNIEMWERGQQSPLAVRAVALCGPVFTLHGCFGVPALIAFSLGREIESRRLKRPRESNSPSAVASP